MLMCRVALGRIAQGRLGLRRPSARADSVTDLVRESESEAYTCMRDCLMPALCMSCLPLLWLAQSTSVTG